MKKNDDGIIEFKDLMVGVEIHFKNREYLQDFLESEGGLIIKTRERTIKSTRDPMMREVRGEGNVLMIYTAHGFPIESIVIARKIGELTVLDNRFA